MSWSSALWRAWAALRSESTLRLRTWKSTVTIDHSNPGSTSPQVPTAGSQVLARPAEVCSREWRQMQARKGARILYNQVLFHASDDNDFCLAQDCQSVCTARSQHHLICFLSSLASQRPCAHSSMYGSFNPAENHIANSIVKFHWSQRHRCEYIIKHISVCVFVCRYFACVTRSWDSGPLHPHEGYYTIIANSFPFHPFTHTPPQTYHHHKCHEPLTYILTLYLILFLAFYLTYIICADTLSDINSDNTGAVRKSRARGWGPVGNTAIGIEVRWEHCHRELAVEVRWGTLPSGAGSWGPMGNTAIRSLVGNTAFESCRRRRRRRRRRKAAGKLT